MMTGPSTPDSVSIDDHCSLLATPERRAVLAALGANGPTRRIAALLDGVADRRNHSTEQERKALHGGLHHVHLPKLAEAGVIEHDTDEGAITLTAAGRRAEEVRERAVAVLDSE